MALQYICKFELIYVTYRIIIFLFKSCIILKGFLVACPLLVRPIELFQHMQGVPYLQICVYNFPWTIQQGTIIEAVLHIALRHLLALPRPAATRHLLHPLRRLQIVLNTHMLITEERRVLPLTTAPLRRRYLLTVGAELLLRMVEIFLLILLFLLPLHDLILCSHATVDLSF